MLGISRFATISSGQLMFQVQRRRVSMKFKSTLIAVAATMLICSQSYAGDLLDRMLGMGGCGCQSSCCDAPVAGPGCGSDMIAAPSCGCDTGCDPCARPKLIDFRFKVNWCSLPRPCFGGCSTGCDTGCDTGCAAPAAPACGCDTVAAPVFAKSAQKKL